MEKNKDLELARKLAKLYFSNQKPRNKNRIPEVLSIVESAWNKNPDLRLCQLIENCKLPNENDMYYVEDSQLAQRLKEYYKV